jgi:hypothetical protein
MMSTVTVGLIAPGVHPESGMGRPVVPLRILQPEVFVTVPSGVDARPSISATGQDSHEYFLAGRAEVAGRNTVNTSTNDSAR